MQCVKPDTSAAQLTPISRKSATETAGGAGGLRSRFVPPTTGVEVLGKTTSTGSGGLMVPTGWSGKLTTDGKAPGEAESARAAPAPLAIAPTRPSAATTATADLRNVRQRRVPLIVCFLPR